MKTPKFMILSALFVVFINFISVNEVFSDNLNNIEGIWNQLTTTGDPPEPRYATSAIYDPVENRMIVFGGWSTSVYNSMNDTWSFDFDTNQWTELSTTGGPPASRAGYVGVYDSSRHRLVVSLGSNWWTTSYNNTWALDLSTLQWSLIATSGTPPNPRLKSYGIYDKARDRLIVFGGIHHFSGPWNDTYELDFSTNTWNQLSTTGDLPTPRNEGSAILDEQNNQMIIFGGHQGDNVALNQVYALDLVSNVWTHLTDFSTGIRYHPAVFHSTRRLMIVVTGGGVYAYDQAIVYDIDANNWLDFNVSGGIPDSRYGAIAVFVPNGERTILFGGGQNLNSGFNDIWEFLLTETDTVSDIDGNVYQTIKIGNQWWMMENLKVTHYNNSDPIPEVTDNSTWAGLASGAYSNFQNDTSYVSTYGRLYNWHAVNDSRNIAPAGWHVPTDDDWKELEMYLGMSQSQANAIGERGTDEGGKMKEAGTAHWNSPNTGATNSSCFTALPGGYRDNDSGAFNGVGGTGSWWSATEYSSTNAWERDLGYVRSVVYRYSSFKRNGFSVRLVRDYVQIKNISTPNTSGGINDIINVPVNISNPDSIAGAEFTVNFDSNILTALSVQKTILTSGFLLADSINNTLGRVSCVLASATAIQSSNPDSLVTITFQVNANASIGDTCSLALTNVALFDENSIPISANVSNGLFTVIPPDQEPPVRIEISLIADTLLLGNEREIYATGFDQFNNPVTINPDWSVTGAIDTVNPTYGDTITFTAESQGIGYIIASLDTLSDSGTIMVCKKGNLFNPADTTIDVRDAVFCLRIAADLITPTPIQFRIADMNDDETVDAADALLILYESLKRLMSAKIGLLAKIAQTGPAKVKMVNSNNQFVSINITERTDICAASLSFSFDSTQVEIVEILPGNPNSLIVSNTQKAGKVKVGLISTDGLINLQDQLIKIKIKSKNSATPELVLEKINIYDAKARAIEIDELSNIDNQELQIPNQFSLNQNYPNPFNPTTTIRYDLPEPANVGIEIYNILGAKVRTLVSGNVAAGVHTTLWNGKNDYGYQVSTGLYIYRIYALCENKKSFVDVKTMLLLK